MMWVSDPHPSSADGVRLRVRKVPEKLSFFENPRIEDSGPTDD